MGNIAVINILQDYCVGMTDDSIDNKDESENSEWQKTVMDSLKECIERASHFRCALRNSIKVKMFESYIGSKVTTSSKKKSLLIKIKHKL